MKNQEHTKRIFKFRAWDEESQLLIRLSKLPCSRGELSMKGHIFLQFTSLYDKNGDEIYEMDVLLFQSDKRLVFWDENLNGWSLAFAMDKAHAERLTSESVKHAIRLGSYYELQEKS
jgi:hypothetical protein